MFLPSLKHLTIGARVRMLAAASLTAALTVSGVALAQPVSPPATTTDCSTLHFDLANPAAGDRLLPGGYVVEGFAFDSAATAEQGTGVDRVDFFLNNRDEGGVNLGTAELGLPNTTAMAGSPFGMAGYRLEVTLPDQSGGQTLFAYAHSTITGQEQVLSVPIQVGGTTDADAPTTFPAATTGRPMCAPAAASTQPMVATSTTAMQPTPQPEATVAPAMTVAPVVTVVPEATVAPVATLHLMLDNPQPGDSLLPGAYSISGTALDTRATSGSGIDRVDIFLGDRDLGGLILGQTGVQPVMTTSENAMPLGSFHIDVNLPEHNAGGTLFAYAHSSVTGEEMIVAIPITVGTVVD